MNSDKLTFDFIEEKIRTKTFGIITTIDTDGSPHTTGVLYGVSSPNTKFALYILTSKKYRKTRNIKRNPTVSFIIPFPHHILRFVPSSTITLTGNVEILPFENEKIFSIFSDKRILRMIIKDLNPEDKMDYIFLKIVPESKIRVYGIGYNIWSLRKSHTEGGYVVRIPEERL
jgi:nitroimidazol reductase NimA-like FMN-containing flavoprotein (pyridoxamine 5'-phosphate oxidase superfamily)